MDALEEKKWFVYVKDHHTGPFTLAEIQNQMRAGAISPANYVWSEGMADWAQMTSVDAFAGVLNPTAHPAFPPDSISFADPDRHANHALHDYPASPASASASLTLAHSAPEPSSDFEPQAYALQEAAEPQAFALHEAVAEPIQLFAEERGSSPSAEPVEPTLSAVADLEPSEPSFAPLHEAEPATGAEATTDSVEATRRPARAGVWIALCFVLLFAGFSFAYIRGMLDPLLANHAIHGAVEATSARVKPGLLKLAQKYPALQKWVSPIPALADVSPDEYAELQKAAMTSDSSPGGAALALAMSREDLTKPAFYVATGAAPAAGVEHLDYDLYVEGVADSLLMQTSFFAVASVSVTQRLGKSAAILGPDHSPVVRGQYRVSVTAHTEGAAPADALPKDAKVLASRTYFLGGPNDAMYLSRLKEFHEHLQSKAGIEIQELKQVETTLESQLSDTNTQFALASGSRLTAAKRLKWSDFHATWTKLSANIAQNYARWSPPGALNEYFHGALYIQTAETAQAIEKLHQAQSDFVSGKVPKNVLDIQLGTLGSVARNMLDSLKSRIDKTAALPASPGGLPQREAVSP